MKRFSRHLWMAALVAAFCPAVVRAQSYAYYPAELAGSGAGADVLISARRVARS